MKKAQRTDENLIDEIVKLEQDKRKISIKLKKERDNIQSHIKKLKRKLDIYNKKALRAHEVKNSFYLNKLFKEKSRPADIAPRLRHLFEEKPVIKYEILETRHGYPHFNATRYHFRINGDVDVFHIGQAFEDLFLLMRSKINNNSIVRLTISALNMNRSTGMLRNINLGIEWINFHTMTFLDYDDLELNEIEFILDVYQPAAGSGRALQILDKDKSRSIIKIPYAGTICLACGIIVGLVKLHLTYIQEIFKNRLTQEEINSINYKRQIKTKINEGAIQENEIKKILEGAAIQQQLARILHRICNVDIKESGNDFGDIIKFEEKLNISIYVYDYAKKLKREPIIVTDSKQSTDKKIYLLYDGSHFNVLTKINEAFTGRVKKLICSACNTKGVTHTGNYITCSECNKSFKGEACFELHKISYCINKSWKCSKCKRTFNAKQRKMEDHECGESYCKNCESWNLEHECYMKPVTIKPSSEKYLFFDFEAWQYNKGETCPCGNACEIGTHHFNQVQALDFTGTKRINMVDRISIRDQFCEEIFKNYKGYTLIAHYGKGYDFQPIAEWLIINKGVKPDVIIKKGEKITYLELKHDYNIRFVDSISLVKIPLKDFAKSFGLKSGKGDFPHLFNTPENYNYIGPYPDKKYYGYKTMIKKNKKEFDLWYNQIKDNEFDFQKEFLNYCLQDVKVLRDGCIVFRNLFIDLCDIDPFQYFTLAQVVSAEYRSHHLPEKTIGVHKNTGKDNYSKKAIQWLKSLNNQNIKHALNGGEVTIGKYKVDGYDESTKTIYQFQGCYFHGCNKCFKYSDVNLYNQQYMGELYKNTMKISGKLRASGYKVIEFWECEMPEPMKKIKIDNLIEPAKVREAFYGGRTEVFKLLFDGKTHQKKMQFIDVVSLYPTVQFYDKYPVGHYKKILKPEKWNPDWFGFVQCKVLPPRKLYIPVLPYKQECKQSHKLMFGLCKACMSKSSVKCKHFEKLQKSNNDEKFKRKIDKINCNECRKFREQSCNHLNEERCITGFWCTNEVQRAIDKGYQIKEIYEVWQFENTSTELFKSYVRKFMKIKLVTSPFNCSKEVYIKKASDIGIDIKAEELIPNAGLRFISKLCLNSLWGKFGQQDSFPKEEYIDNEQQLYKLFCNNKISDLNLTFINQKLIHAHYKLNDNDLKENFNTNVYIAAFTTSSARLRLYDMLDRLGDRAIYCDTDSVVYIDDDYAKDVVKIGDSLGEFSYDDKVGENRWIDFWTSSAPKDYGFILNDLSTVGKIKGFKSDSLIEDNITPENRKKLITKMVDYFLFKQSYFLVKDYKIRTVEREKVWTFSYDKRIVKIVDDTHIDSLPYGY